MTKRLSAEQKIFNKVVTHLGKQHVKSISDYGACMYRGRNGTKCAVGCLIKDEFYDEALERKIPGHPKVADALNKSGIDIDGLPSSPGGFLFRLQGIHDNHNPINWPRLLKKFSQDFGLDGSVVSKAFNNI